MCSSLAPCGIALGKIDADNNTRYASHLHGASYGFSGGSNVTHLFNHVAVSLLRCVTWPASERGIVTSLRLRMAAFILARALAGANFLVCIEPRQPDYTASL